VSCNKYGSISTLKHQNVVERMKEYMACYSEEWSGIYILRTRRVCCATLHQSSGYHVIQPRKQTAYVITITTWSTPCHNSCLTHQLQSYPSTSRKPRQLMLHSSVSILISTLSLVHSRQPSFCPTSI
jgi:hypothetical protein